MSTINKAILIGHLGDDIQIFTFEGGGMIGRVPMATNETWKNKEGEKQTRTDWHNLVFRNKSAEIMEKYTTKGDKLFVEGSIQTRKWQTSDGQDRFTTEIHVKDFKFLSTKGSTNSDSKPSSQPEPGSYSETGDDDDLPF